MVPCPRMEMSTDPPPTTVEMDTINGFTNTTIGGKIVCDLTGFMDDMTNLNMYYQCDTGDRVHHRPCPGGLIWNQKLSYCDWPNNVV